MGSAVWTGERFRYSAEDIELIRDKMWSKAGPKIEAAAEDYRVELLLRNEMPKAAQVNKELRKLSESIRRVLDASKGLDDLALETIQVWASSQFEGSGLGEVMAVRRKLGSLALRLERAADENGKVGRSRGEARRRFVYRLAEIWEQVFGEWPRRQHGFDTWNATHEEHGQFLDIVRACIAPVSPPALRGVEDDVRYVASLGKNRNQN